MTRRHFEKLADAIRDSLDVAESDTARTAIRGLASKIADVCKSENIRFQAERFIRACGMAAILLTLATTARHHTGGHSGGHSHYSQA